MERQYLELWADASWKLRRLSRLEAQAWEDDGLEEDARLTKLERLSRLQTTLRRQLDRAVRMLSHDLPHLFAHRTREDVMQKLNLTETLCAENPYRQKDVEQAVQAHLHWPHAAEQLAHGLDNAAPPAPEAEPMAPEDAPTADAHEICRNELLPQEGEDAPDQDIPPRAARSADSACRRWRTCLTAGR